MNTICSHYGNPKKQVTYRQPTKPSMTTKQIIVF